MGITLRFVGGPADGRSMSVPRDEPPPIFLIPVIPPVTDLLTVHLGPTPIEKAEYEPLREDGWPRRNDDGTYLYQHRPAPVTAEQRAATGQARREAQAAESARDAEADAAWREIREQRPNYPENWRDAF